MIPCTRIAFHVLLQLVDKSLAHDSQLFLSRLVLFVFFLFVLFLAVLFLLEALVGDFLIADSGALKLVASRQLNGLHLARLTDQPAIGGGDAEGAPRQIVLGFLVVGFDFQCAGVEPLGLVEGTNVTQGISQLVNQFDVPGIHLDEGETHAERLLFVALG